MATNDNLQQQLIKDLLVESFDALDRFDREMLLLEKGEGDAETLNSVFRIIHTIKGSSGCIGLNKVESVAHVGESLLSVVRDGQLAITPALVTALLEFLRRPQGHPAPPGANRRTRRGGLRAPAPKTASASNRGAGGIKTGAGLWFVRRYPGTAATTEPVPKPETAAAALPAPQPPSPAPPHAPAPVTETRPAEAETAAKHGPSVSDTAVRVDVTQLDKLMNLVGELVLARNQIVQYTAQTKEPTLLNAAQRLNIITTELQESVMKTRMQPIGNIWAKFPRIVHDLAQELGKKVQLVMDGKETELDRTIIEAIKDPLTHIVRNSVDHGIERPEERAAAGKPQQGVLILRAFHEGGQVNIEIMDDGQGIDIVKVKEKAVAAGLVTADQAGRMSNREAFNLIFLPGFSTAEKVTNVSGRGVGMDVVKTNIEKIGGSVDVVSEAGQAPR